MRPHQPLVSRWLPTIRHLIPLLRVCQVRLAAAEPLRRSAVKRQLRGGAIIQGAAFVLLGAPFLLRG